VATFRAIHSHIAVIRADKRPGRHPPGNPDGADQLGLNADGTVAVPTSVQVARLVLTGPISWAVGSAVILGHVTPTRDGVVLPTPDPATGNQIAGSADGVIATFR